MRFPTASTHVVILLILAWLSCFGLGFAVLLHDKHVPGQHGQQPLELPSDLPFCKSTTGNTSIMFAHPKCPCTRASLNELARIVAKAPDDFLTNVVFYRPENADDAWIDNDVVNLASNMRNVQVHWDVAGKLADKFQAKTSGHVVLYSPQGKLLFSGGITALRGHEGDNVSSHALLNQALQKPSQRYVGPVFGCPL